MRKILLTLAATCALLVSGLTWTGTADARPWGYYRAPVARYYGGYGYSPYYYGYSPYYSYRPYYYGGYPYSSTYGYPYYYGTPYFGSRVYYYY